MARLTDKRILITGGTTGIGFASAQRFLDEGARVAITGQSETRLAEAVQSLGGEVRGYRANARSIAELEMLAEAVRKDFGGVDVLFANAGLGVFAPIEAIDEAAYDKQFDINVKGVFFTVQKILPLMSKGGSIILTSSAVSEKGVGTGSLYFATKAAVRSLARTLAAELGERQIRVNTLSPGVVRTHFSKSVNLPEDQFEAFMTMVVSQAPLGREGSTDDMASAALFLASDEASYMTASDLVVDGGWMNV